MGLLYALIMAGGGGTRLWPESRLALPKQLIKLFDQSSLIQIAFERVVPLIPPERVLVVTGQRYKEMILAQLPGLPDENVVAEPQGKNTAPAIGLGAVHLRRRDPTAVMAVLTADHLMRKEDTFRAALSAAAQAAASGTPEDAAEGGRIVTLGITPSKPETGYGYIERGDQLGQYDRHTVFRVARFREKPDQAAAEQFVRSGRFYWNSGMFIWQTSTVLEEIRRQLPDLYGTLTEIEHALGTREEAEVMSRVWPTIKPISVDYGVMEGARNVAVLPVDPGWSDVGSWSAVYEESQPKGADQNVAQGCEHLAIETRGCLVRSKKLVTTIGLKDLVIVDTDDALLICPRAEAQRVRQIVGRLKEEKRTEYL
jgi:mannose-1-phosphate guanylyltransferase